MNNTSLKKIISLLSLAFLIFGVVSFFEGIKTDKITSKAQVYEGCPPTQLVAGRDLEWVGVADFCIMKEELDLFQPSGRSWESSARECAVIGGLEARLCTAAEWIAACEITRSGELLEDELGADMLDGEEWVADIVDLNDAIVVGTGANCNEVSTGGYNGADSFNRRCCINKQY
jgi:hypothetical protein